MPCSRFAGLPVATHESLENTLRMAWFAKMLLPLRILGRWKAWVGALA
jgi:hypothetical protein